MTGPENERLAILETKVTGIDDRTDRLEKKVDILVERSAGWTGAVAFARSLVPFIAVGVSLAALVVSMRGG